MRRRFLLKIYVAGVCCIKVVPRRVLDLGIPRSEGALKGCVQHRAHGNAVGVPRRLSADASA
jgi:hypothetical protein